MMCLFLNNPNKLLDNKIDDSTAEKNIDAVKEANVAAKLKKRNTDLYSPLDKTQIWVR